MCVIQYYDRVDRVIAYTYLPTLPEGQLSCRYLTFKSNFKISYIHPYKISNSTSMRIQLRLSTLSGIFVSKLIFITCFIAIPLNSLIIISVTIYRILLLFTSQFSLIFFTNVTKLVILYIKSKP